DNDNGVDYGFLGVPLAIGATAPNDPNVGLWQLARFNYALPATLSVRDTVMNFHFALPHGSNGLRDDIQVLYDGESIHNGFYQSLNDATGGNTGTAIGVPFYVDGYQYGCANVGSVLNQGQANASSSCMAPYLYPNGPLNRPANIGGFASSCPGEPAGAIGPIGGTPCSFIDAGLRDTSWNNQQIVKLQYQKNFSENAYLRVYGYTYYSDWLLTGPNLTANIYTTPGLGIGPTAPDYELTAHTRGASATFADQLNSQNLLTVQGNYTTSNAVRDNNEQMLNPLTQPYGYVTVNAADPYSGYCYGAAGGAAVTCNPTLGNSLLGGTTPAQFANWAQIASGATPALPATCIDPKVSSTTCAYLAAENGQYGYYNAVTPEFTAFSITDQFRPNDRWLFNLGLRENIYRFVGQDVSEGPARQFWYNAYNLDTCQNNATGGVADVSTITGASPGTCPSGFTPVTLNNDVNGSTQSFSVFEPRFAFTFTQNPNTVWRGSIGKFSQPPDTATEQYNTLQLDEPFTVLGPVFYQYGRTSPSYPIYPPTSTNVDLSYEHHINGTDMSFKLTPFYRHTQNQLQNFYLNQAQGFISELNVGAQSSRGLEFQFQKGDLTRNGFAALLSFAYTYSTIKYQSLSNGSTIIAPINSTISNYNAYTKACTPVANGGTGTAIGQKQYGQSICGSTVSGAVAAPCYAIGTAGVPPTSTTPAVPAVPGAADPTCAAADYGNPYWNASVQSLINPSQPFPTYDIFPAGIGSSDSAFGAPYVGTLVLNYRHDKWAITPSLQFQAGTRYGAPETTPGLAPDACYGSLAAGTDARYPYGNPAANTVDYGTCLANGSPTIVIPDPYTHQFDPLGSFIQPTQFMLNMQLSYDVSPRITLTAALTNIVNGCFGGTKAAWTSNNGNYCSYGVVGSGLVAPIVPAGGNTYNPGDPIQAFRQYPYEPGLGPFDVSGLNFTTKQPFQLFVEANIKI
ncbi:MAG: TonB-dependent receptor, partial [Candidatus Eremiobacteraeota bacterium]|nr:TonB-dependent receptor [Candidatus Eremiobacteraeota bacterium]